MKLYNTPHRKLEEFTPLTPGEVLVYTCGPTVYSKQHIGNYASFVYWDVLVRALTANGYNVKRVLNLTDVGHLVSDGDEGEDKVEKGARLEGKTAWQVADEWGTDFVQNFHKLNLLEPYKLIKATSCINEDLELVRTLKEKGYTYQIDDGIYYDTSRFPRYADFAHLNLKDLQAGARVEFNQQKRGAADFALWKFTPKGTKRDMEWETPADLMDNSETGRMGFPGWHLECSAIIKRELGDTIDIHTGGIEHIPVHHTNEIAQSEAANDKPFVNYWLHAHHLTADGAKMSKSLGNGYTLDDVNERGFSHMDFKMWVLQGHFQSDRNFTFEDLAAAHQRLLRWRNAAALRHQVKNNEGGEQPSRAVLKAILNAVSDNLGTPQAMALADQAFVDIWNTAVSHISKGNLREFLDTIDELFGLNLLGTTPDISDDVKKLILQRERARDAKNWEESDRIRAEVEQHGIAIRDLPAGHGSVWEYSN